MPSIFHRRLSAGLVALALTMPQPAFAQTPDFGDDTSPYANDGECDDLRFEGDGMTNTLLLESDVGHDATDCRVAFQQNRLELAGPDNAAKGLALALGEIDFGNNDSPYALDGECDDVRFVGEGMADALLTDNIGRDAADCETAYEKDRIVFNALFAPPTKANPIDFGDNTAGYANDGECDDIRFTGDYASDVVYIAEDIGHDANDCRNAVLSGVARWQGNDLPPNFGQVSEEDQ
ncbi:MAG: hypothetical protein WAT93_12425 [Pontixanthobacter sp.]